MWKIERKGKEYLHGLMEENIMENGEMASNMAMVLFLIRMAISCSEHGRTERKLNDIYESTLLISF